MSSKQDSAGGLRTVNGRVVSGVEFASRSVSRCGDLSLGTNRQDEIAGLGHGNSHIASPSSNGLCFEDKVIVRLVGGSFKCDRACVHGSGEAVKDFVDGVVITFAVVSMLKVSSPMVTETVPAAAVMLDNAKRYLPLAPSVTLLKPSTQPAFQSDCRQ